jgi:hypothetical protein
LVTEPLPRNEKDCGAGETGVAHLISSDLRTDAEKAYGRSLPKPERVEEVAPTRQPQEW